MAGRLKLRQFTEADVQIARDYVIDKTGDLRIPKVESWCGNTVRVDRKFKRWLLDVLPNRHVIFFAKHQDIENLFARPQSLVKIRTGGRRYNRSVTAYLLNDVKGYVSSGTVFDSEQLKCLLSFLNLHDDFFREVYYACDHGRQHTIELW